MFDFRSSSENSLMLPEIEISPNVYLSPSSTSTVIFNHSSLLINNSEGFDNKDNTDNRLVSINPLDFMRYNISAPECCKYSSSYSNGTGCICSTPTQQKILNSRGSSY